MRKISPTTRFRRDYKREQRGRFRHILTTELDAIIALLAKDEPLEVRHGDHALTGNWDDHRDYHIRPDLVLIYRKPDPNTLQLVRLGSHSELELS